MVKQNTQATLMYLVSQQDVEGKSKRKDEQREAEGEELDEGDEDLAHHDDVDADARQTPQEEDDVQPRDEHARRSQLPLPVLANQTQSAASCTSRILTCNNSA